MLRHAALCCVSMRALLGEYRRHLRASNRHRALAPCIVMRHDAHMATLRPHTKAYPAEARKQLGLAVTRAREAAGFAYRPAFARAAGVSVRSIVNLEHGEPVGPAIYEAAARALPGWGEDAPRRILEGEEPPAVSESADRPMLGEPGSDELTDGERVMIRKLRRLGWSPERVADFLEALREDEAALPRVEQRSETDRSRNVVPYDQPGESSA